MPSTSTRQLFNYSIALCNTSFDVNISKQESLTTKNLCKQIWKLNLQYVWKKNCHNSKDKFLYSPHKDKETRFNSELKGTLFNSKLNKGKKRKNSGYNW